jgi:hypothetical protein|tara:strand:- start:187 stop:372 length:186 start_codon:yes stop_codon:yes gene_type:complete
MKLTSVKILKELHREFKILSIREDFSLQKLVNRSIHKFLVDEEYKKELINYTQLQVSGSGM